ncbi:uncharacterized protein LOC125178529 [Hyalella azteca]|uniref:Uncharacterized protein LOC125178529 n=1 Tax=Hyalella azteca TaxID=294128 RepID=A0A979FPQ1_HYAAZ|nr:uncharacterized protein LOC125178529 [Hyalella azteca]
MMDLRLLSALGALLCVCCSIEDGSAFTFKTFTGTEIATTAISTTVVVERPCECRALCRDACAAVAIRRQSRSRYRCSFTGQSITDTSTGTDLLVRAPDSRVFYKRQGCRPNFSLVDNVGCIYLSTVKLNFTAAAASCPSGSQLFTASFLIDFDAMRNYLLKNYLSSLETAWVGLSRTSNPKTWEWLGGGTIPSIQPSPYWGKYDPDGATDCPAMHYSLSAGYLYHLADLACGDNLKFLCKQN